VPFYTKNDHFTKTGSGQTLGNLKKEYRFLQHCGGTPNFLTGMGSYLQSVIQGWGGVRYNVVPGAMTLLPQAPQDSTTNLTLAGLHFRATSVSLSILPTHAVLSHAHGVAPMVTYTPPAVDSFIGVGAENITVTLQPGQVVSVALGRLVVVKCKEEPRGS
jgi:hypothetical protein